MFRKILMSLQNAIDQNMQVIFGETQQNVGLKDVHL